MICIQYCAKWHPDSFVTQYGFLVLLLCLHYMSTVSLVKHIIIFYWCLLLSEYNGTINVLHFACNWDFVHVHHHTHKQGLIVPHCAIPLSCYLSIVCLWCSSSLVAWKLPLLTDKAFIYLNELFFFWKHYCVLYFLALVNVKLNSYLWSAVTKIIIFLSFSSVIISK